MGEFPMEEKFGIFSNSFANKMKIVISVCLCVFQLTMTYDIDLKELLARAENEIKASFQSQMMTGARSSRINLNKFTAV